MLPDRNPTLRDKIKANAALAAAVKPIRKKIGKRSKGRKK